MMAEPSLRGCLGTLDPSTLDEARITHPQAQRGSRSRGEASASTSFAHHLAAAIAGCEATASTVRGCAGPASSSNSTRGIGNAEWAACPIMVAAGGAGPKGHQRRSRGGSSSSSSSSSGCLLLM